MLIRLGDEDRKRLGVDEEWLTFDGAELTVNQSIVLQHEAGYRSLPYDLNDAWNAQYQFDPDDPEKVVGYVRDAALFKALVWAAMHRAGIRIPYGELDFVLTAVNWKPDPEVGDETSPGKEPDSIPTRTSEP